ncbi:MAG: response regulator transcription factor [Actinomycetota bacterium]|nr:response regulator transcription factor [Actinomycetota bacterium]
MTTTPLKVVVADDHPMIREGLRTVLNALPDFELAAVAATGEEAVAVATATQSDLVIMDLHMPDLDGVKATARILAGRPQVGVLVLTMYDDDQMLIAALKAGARGYLLKGANHDEIVRALRSVAAGEAVFGRGVAEQALNRLRGQHSTTNPFPQLTEREMEILKLLGEGLGTQQIAHKLFLSAKTVRNHIANILPKLDVNDRAHAIALAREAGLGSLATG